MTNNGWNAASVDFADRATLAPEVRSSVSQGDPSTVEEGSAFTGTTFERLQERYGRLARYATTSLFSLGISEATLLAVFATRSANATMSAVIGNLAGTIPSYLLSRYWIWKEADRHRAGRQVALYWLVSIVCMGITSVATGVISALSPLGHVKHVIIAGSAFLALNVVLWLAKYVLYHTVIFRTHKLVPEYEPA